MKSIAAASSRESMAYIGGDFVMQVYCSGGWRRDSILFFLFALFGGDAGGVTGAEILKPLGLALGICLLGIWTGEIGIVIAGAVGEVDDGPVPWDGGGVGVPLGSKTAAMVDVLQVSVWVKIRC